ncbi:TetR/AcrR family transcriptional regulator [Paramixta manurensis]|uniref:TetR/AcrR family transcriptional regulator n=1 Tax=Paramixta manurensis TaxID=2740817 RepID=A0A6M8UJM1_9GAMM|nr:TetR/AcrR family transcriptional regulator [Erwiniaceae bacterium PD-1]
MNKVTRNDTCEHLLATGEQLCLQRGFTGMGLSELLSLAGVPKGSFYHYFRSKEAFGVALLERYFALSNHVLRAWFADEESNPRQRILDYYARAERTFREHGHIEGCLAVKLSAEVCDLSEEMRNAMNNGSAAVIEILTHALQQASTKNALRLARSPDDIAETIYLLWLGASLQSKMRRDSGPLANALVEIERMLTIA